MRPGILLLFCFVASPFLMSTSCNKTAQCKDAICTMIFAGITVEVTDAAGNPVAADEVFTVRKQNKERIVLSQFAGNGRFVVLDDSYVKKMLNSKELFTFIAMKNGMKLFEEDYTISADCCHVKKELGKDKIVVSSVR